MCGCKTKKCNSDCQAGQPKTSCDLIPSGDVVYSGDDIQIGETIVATKGDKLNDVLQNMANEISNLQP